MFSFPCTMCLYFFSLPLSSLFLRWLLFLFAMPCKNSLHAGHQMEIIWIHISAIFLLLTCLRLKVPICLLIPQVLLNLKWLWGIATQIHKAFYILSASIKMGGFISLFLPVKTVKYVGGHLVRLLRCLSEICPIPQRPGTCREENAVSMDFVHCLEAIGQTTTKKFQDYTLPN